MGGGRKRGRTQRKHFKQNRDNVWKHDRNKQPPPPDAAGDGNGNGEGDGDGSEKNPNPNWQPFATENPGFDEYYKEQGIVPESEWEEFVSVLRKPLPAAFRINASCQFFEDIRLQLENDFRKSLEAEVSDEHEVEAIRPLPWYPGNLAWHLNFSRMQLRRTQALERFHEFLKQENDVGNLTRQEAVSMVPPLFLDVRPEYHILDMCAAPGSKTFQLLEMIHHKIEPGLLPSGLVIANDVDVQRCNLLIHQTKRMSTANLIVTNHEAQNFPGCSVTKACLETCKEEGRMYTLQFDRVLCDVPCSGDGTLRKAPDMWRKWNAGMGNGLHRLQVEIAMRGIALLKVGGRMVYSTCSMNPIENEAVVAEILRRAGNSVEVLDVSEELPELVRRPGISTWKVKDRGSWFTSYEDVPLIRRNVILPSMFPSGLSCKQSNTVSEVLERNADIVDSDVRAVMDEKKADQNNNIVGQESTEDSPNMPAKDLDTRSSTTKLPAFPLHRCMRIVPHDQNSGAFFIAVLQKLSPLQENPMINLSEVTQTVSEDKTDNLEDECKAEKQPLEDLSCNDHQTVSKEENNAKLLDEQSKALLDKNNKSKSSEAVELFDNRDNGQVGSRGRKRKLQIQGKWRGVDPVVFFRDDQVITSIVSFYGISESFPLKNNLVTRNEDANHVKRIYYISNSVRDALQLNFQVGQRLKITSLGLKVFERQSSKDGEPCKFRLSSEGLLLLLPYIGKQILYASLVDFQNLLQHRTIKFPDFVDAKFREKASALMPGCCVVVLHEAHQNVESTVVDASSIAIVCWKGKASLCIMVSQPDGKELLERLAFRYGLKTTKQEENESSNIETDRLVNSDDAEIADSIEVADEGSVLEGEMLED